MQVHPAVRALVLTAATWATTVSAQSPSAAAADMPPSGANPAAAWLSAFHGYKPHGESTVAPWRESNEQVGRIGGWRAYAREAQGAAAPAPAAAVPALPQDGHRHPSKH